MLPRVFIWSLCHSKFGPHGVPTWSSLGPDFEKFRSLENILNFTLIVFQRNHYMTLWRVWRSWRRSLRRVRELTPVEWKLLKSSRRIFPLPAQEQEIFQISRWAPAAANIFLPPSWWSQDFCSGVQEVECWWEIKALREKLLIVKGKITTKFTFLPNRAATKNKLCQNVGGTTEH